jgi:hypothetical protein
MIEQKSFAAKISWPGKLVSLALIWARTDSVALWLRLGARKFIPHISSIMEGALDFPIGGVLAERINRPDAGRNPSDDRELQDEADDTRKRAADGKERQPRQQERD